MTSYWFHKDVQYFPGDIVEFSELAAHGSGTKECRVLGIVRCVHDTQMCVDTTETLGRKMEGAGCNHTWRITPHSDYGISLHKKNAITPFLDEIRKVTAV